MIFTRRGFLGAMLGLLAWLGLGKAVPKASATVDIPCDGGNDLGSRCVGHVMVQADGWVKIVYDEKADRYIQVYDEFPLPENL